MKEKLWLIILPIVLLALNIFLIWPLFLGGSTQHFGSIESVFLASAKFISENFPHINFYPFWYFGFPFYLTYQPIVPFGLALVHFLTNLPLETIYRFASGIFYALGSISLYFLVHYLIKNKVIAFLSGLIYSFAPSIGYLIAEVRGVGESFSFLPWRAIVLNIYGEGPHIWALAFTPLAVLFTLRLLREPSRINWVFSVLFTSIILLTSLTAFLALLIFLALIFIAEVCRSEIKKKISISFILLLFVLGFSAFWYNLSFVKAALSYTASEGGGVFTGIYQNPVLILAFAFPLLAIFIIFLAPLFKKPNFPLWFISAGSFLLIFLSIYFWYSFRVGLLPLPFRSIPRFIPELELALALFLGVFLSFIYNRLFNFKKILAFGFIVILLAMISFLIPSRQKAFWEITKPHPNFTETSEYQISKWLSENTKEGRVYATGTHAFWLNVFSDVPQLRGGKGGDFGGLNPFWAHLTYQIYYGDDGELAKNWLVALGIKYIVVNFPESKVTYHDFQYPYKFEGILKRVFKYQGDVIYEVPVKYPELVTKVEKEELDKAGIFWNAREGKITLDKERLNQYLQATELSSQFKNLPYEYKKPWSKLKITPTNLKPGEEVLVRISYHPGWRAFQNGKRIKIERDPLGFMILSPANSNSDITLKFKPTLDVYFGYLLTTATLIAFIFFLKKPTYRFAWLDGKKKVELKPEEEDEGA